MNETENMPAGPELDALVAEKVMGWGRSGPYRRYWLREAEPDRYEITYAIDGVAEADEEARVWACSADITQAWTVLGKITEEKWSKTRFEIALAELSGWKAEDGGPDRGGAYEWLCTRTDAPLAISRAALKAVDEKEPS